MEQNFFSSFLAFFRSRKALFLVPALLLLQIYSQLCLIRTSHVWQITDPYILSYYFLNYDAGFIPRGLVGTFYCFLTKYISGNLFFAILFALSGAFFLGCVLAALNYLRKIEDEGTFSSLLLALLLLLAVPPSRSCLLYHFGRLDLFLFAITLFSTLAIFRDSLWKYLVLLLVPAGVMIHEIFLLLFLPLICATAFYRTDRKKPRSVFYLVLLFLSCVFSLVLLYFMRKNMPAPAVLDALCVKNCNVGKTGDLGVAIYADKTYWEHFVYAFKSTMLTDYALGYIVSFLVFLAAGYYPFTLWKKAYESLPEEEKLLRWKFLFLLAAALIPNLACLIATDHSRWQTAFLLDIVLVVFLLYGDGKLSLKFPSPSQKTLQWIFWTCLFSLVCGITTECHFSNVLTGICLKAARLFKGVFMFLFS
ncbi:MAG: hypothetical protein J6A21_06635 [Lentisphaeria bacterium]|nr:hypothetical protein [Lentisphaeria bacterium]